MNEIEELKNILGVNDLSTLSKKDTLKVMKLVSEHKLSEAHLRTLIEVCPQFVGLSVESLKTMQSAAAGAKESQAAAFASFSKAVEGILDALSALAKNAETDETRIEIAKILHESANIFVELAKISKEMNSDNNSVWKYIAGATATIGLAAVGVVGIFFYGKDKS